MHAKIIKPKSDGKNAYQNTSSAARTLNYLVQESSRQGKEAVFFGASADGLTAAEVQASIDGNVKGLKESDVKFYSLVLSPSDAELTHIGSDEAKLKAFTRAAMEQYAGNYTLSNGRELTSKDLVWAATMHHTRSYRGDDEQVLAGEKKEGDKKEGRQTHIHIIVSARDAEQKITLNPQGQKRRFDMQQWQGKVKQTFDKSFGMAPEAQQVKQKVSKPLTPEQEAKREERLRVRVTFINSHLGAAHRLDPALVLKIAQERQYDKSFYRNLNFVGRRAEEGRPVEQPHKYLETGLVEKPIVVSRQLKAVLKAVEAASGTVPTRSHVQEIGEERKRGEKEY